MLNYNKETKSKKDGYSDTMKQFSLKLTHENYEDMRSGLRLLKENGIEITESEYVRRAIFEYSAYMINDRYRVQEYIDKGLEASISHWDKSIVKTLGDLFYHVRVIEEMLNLYFYKQQMTPQQEVAARWNRLREGDYEELPEFARHYDSEYEHLEGYKEKLARTIKKDTSVREVAETCLDLIQMENEEKERQK